MKNSAKKMNGISWNGLKNKENGISLNGPQIVMKAKIPNLCGITHRIIKFLEWNKKKMEIKMNGISWNRLKNHEQKKKKIAWD